MSKKITLDLETEKKICELILTTTQKEISKIFGVSQTFIYGVLKKNKIVTVGRYRLNEGKLNVDIEYFNEIDKPEKAYWLGYLAADGHINKINTKCQLVSKDLEIIEKFKKEIKSDHKISEVRTKDKRTLKTYMTYSIQITNKNFVLNLNKHGINPTKSNEFLVPKIDDELLPYFFGGLFDGDGYVGIKNNKMRISLISTKEVLLFLQNYLLINCSISVTKLQRVSKKNVWKLLLYKDSILFLNWIYRDKSFNFLKRKYEKYVSFVR